MNRSLYRITAYVQIGIMILLSTGCAPTQPFFLNESPDLQHYLNTATAIEYPDVQVESLAETTESLRPLTLGNHDYQFWDLSLEECISIALGNAKFFITFENANEFRQNAGNQFISANADQLGSIYDIAIQQATTQSVPLTVDGNGNRVLPRGVLRSTQVGGVEDALAEFDAQASGFVNYSTTDRAQNVGAANIINPQFTVAKSTTQQSAISKRIGTGGVATLRQQILYSRNNTPITPNSRAVASDWTALIEAQVQHPLMRNRGTLVNRVPVVLASLNEDDAITRFEIQIRNLVRDVEVAYWDLYISYRNVATSTVGRNSAIATAQFARLNMENGTGTRQELAQAVAQYFQFRGQLESALAGSNVPGDDRFGVYGRERALREMLGLAATDGRLIRPIEEPTAARVEFDWDESVAQTLYLSPELRRDKVRIKQSELELITAKNQILPDVNLSLLYRWVGVGDTLGPPGRRDVNFPTPGSSALGELTEGNYQEGEIRLEITPPAFGARRELTRIRGSQLRLLREKSKLQESERLVVHQLSDAIGKATTHYHLMETHAQRWQAAENEVEARFAEFKTGRSPVNVVLDSQQRKAQAELAYYQALGEYNKSLNYVDFVKGTMLANSNITLAEGPWNSKAYCDALERARERSAGKEYQYGVSRPGVVRTGPVRDAAGALQIMNSRTSLGPTVDGIDMNASPLDPTPLPHGLNLESYADPAIIDSKPLSEMGTPHEMFAPGPTDRQIDAIIPKNAGPETLPSQTLPSRSGNGNSILVPPNVEPLPPASGTPEPVTDLPPLIQASYEVGDINIENAPKPVRRRPLPTR